jgi:hypothetical protein
MEVIEQICGGDAGGAGDGADGDAFGGKVEGKVLDEEHATV